MRGISCNTKESSGRSHSLTKEDGTWDLSRGDPVTENVLDNIVNSGFPFHLKKIELSGLMIPKVFFRFNLLGTRSGPRQERNSGLSSFRVDTSRLN